MQAPADLSERARGSTSARKLVRERKGVCKRPQTCQKTKGGSLGSVSASELEGKVGVEAMGKRGSVSASELNQKVGGEGQSAEGRRV